MTGGADMGFGQAPSMMARRRIAMALGQQPGVPMAGDPLPGGTQPPSEGGQLQGQLLGGTDGGNVADGGGGGQRTDNPSFGSFSEMMNDPTFQGDWGKVAAMSGPMALGAGAASAMTGIGGLGNAIQEGFGAPALGGGANMAAMGGAGAAAASALDQQSLDQDPNSFSGGLGASMAGLDLSDAGLDAAGGMGADIPGTGGMADPGSMAEGSSPGMFAGGGVVMPGDLAGPNPPGPDTGYAGLTPGEVVLNPGQQRNVGMGRIAQALRGAPGGPPAGPRPGGPPPPPGGAPFGQRPQRPQGGFGGRPAFPQRRM